MSAPWLTVSQPLSNIRIIGDGYFAVDEQAAFVPTLRRLTAETKPLEEGIIAIRTPYKTPISLGDNWYQVSTFFDLPDTSESQKLSLGLPGIESRLGAFDIRSVRLRFTRPSLSAQEFWQTIKAEARRAYKRLQ